MAVRDAETGWKLSTTHAAAQPVAAVRACAREAGSDAVLDWLKQCPGAVAWPAADVALLERNACAATVCAAGPTRNACPP